jgi:hypothetical protein
MLEALKLRQNFIFDLESINKTKWKELVELDLSKNHINKLNLSRVEMGLVNLRLTLESKDYGENFMEDLNVLFKLKIISVTQICTFIII